MKAERIGVYDMKFGNTIIRNLLAEDIAATIEEGHEHPPSATMTRTEQNENH